MTGDCVTDQDHRGAETGQDLVGDPGPVGQVWPGSEADTLELPQIREMSRSLEELDLCPLPPRPAFHTGPEENRAGRQQVQL